MDAIQSSSYCESDEMDVSKSNECESTICTNITHTASAFDVLLSLREDEVLCDVRLRADDGTTFVAHKVVLMSASEYFRAMFTNFSEHKKDIVDIRGLDSTVLKLMLDYMYKGKIRISPENVQVLLPAANLLQLDYVKDACAKFLQKQLDPTNCLGIRSFADLHNCLKLFSSSEAYTRQMFLDVIKNDEFLSLSPEELIKLISGNVLNAPEEKVYESVINWVKHETNVRYDSLPKLMEHVRLPLVSLDYISKNVVDEPLFKNIPKSKDYLIEAFQFHKLEKPQLKISQTIRSTPRMSGEKVILAFSESLETHIYDPITNLWKRLQDISPVFSDDHNDFIDKITLIKKHIVVVSNSYSPSLTILDLSLKSPSWVSLDDNLINRKCCGLGVLNNCLYAVGGCKRGPFNHECLNSTQVFDMSTKKRRMVSSMSTRRTDLGVGVLNNLLYAVGGWNGDGSTSLKSVECYDPSLNTWTPVADMSACRSHVGIGVLNGVLYAVGGENNNSCLKSVEAYTPSSGVWTSITDMHLARTNSCVFTTNGLLYVVGGNSDVFNYSVFSKYETYEGQMDSLEIYDPRTNTWSIQKYPENISAIIGGVIVEKAFIIIHQMS